LIFQGVLAGVVVNDQLQCERTFRELADCPAQAFPEILDDLPVELLRGDQELRPQWASHDHSAVRIQELPHASTAQLVQSDRVSHVSRSHAEHSALAESLPRNSESFLFCLQRSCRKVQLYPRNTHLPKVGTHDLSRPSKSVLRAENRVRMHHVHPGVARAQHELSESDCTEALPLVTRVSVLHAWGFRVQGLYPGRHLGTTGVVCVVEYVLGRTVAGHELALPD